MPARVAVDIHARSTKHLLDIAATILTADAPGLSADAAFDALLSRERLGSTAIGGGVAIPHGRLTLVPAPRAAVLRLARPLDMDGPDGHGVDLVVAVLVPEQCGTGDLDVLSTLVEDLTDPGFRELLRAARGARALFDLMSATRRGAAA